MHPRNLLEVEAPVVLDVVAEAAGELDVLVLVLDEALDELLPQAASSRHVLAAAAAVINAVCLTVSSSGPGLPEHNGVIPPGQTARRLFRQRVGR
jgi:hypothetical protein